MKNLLNKGKIKGFALLSYIVITIAASTPSYAENDQPDPWLAAASPIQRTAFQRQIDRLRTALDENKGNWPTDVRTKERRKTRMTPLADILAAGGKMLDEFRLRDLPYHNTFMEKEDKDARHIEAIRDVFFDKSFFGSLIGTQALVSQLSEPGKVRIDWLKLRLVQMRNTLDGYAKADAELYKHIQQAVTADRQVLPALRDQLFSKRPNWDAFLDGETKRQLAAKEEVRRKAGVVSLEQDLKEAKEAAARQSYFQRAKNMAWGLKEGTKERVSRVAKRTKEAAQRAKKASIDAAHFVAGKAKSSMVNMLRWTGTEWVGEWVVDHKGELAAAAAIAGAGVGLGGLIYLGGQLLTPTMANALVMTGAVTYANGTSRELYLQYDTVEYKASEPYMNFTFRFADVNGNVTPKFTLKPDASGNIKGPAPLGPPPPPRPTGRTILTTPSEIPPSDIVIQFIPQPGHCPTGCGPGTINFDCPSLQYFATDSSMATDGYSHFLVPICPTPTGETGTTGGSSGVAGVSSSGNGEPVVEESSSAHGGGTVTPPVQNADSGGGDPSNYIYAAGGIGLVIAVVVIGYCYKVGKCRWNQKVKVEDHTATCPKVMAFKQGLAVSLPEVRDVHRFNAILDATAPFLQEAGMPIAEADESTWIRLGQAASIVCPIRAAPKTDALKTMKADEVTFNFQELRDRQGELVAVIKRLEKGEGIQAIRDSLRESKHKTPESNETGASPADVAIGGAASGQKPGTMKSNKRASDSGIPVTRARQSEIRGETGAAATYGEPMPPVLSDTEVLDQEEGKSRKSKPKKGTKGKQGSAAPGDVTVDVGEEVELTPPAEHTPPGEHTPPSAKDKKRTSGVADSAASPRSAQVEGEPSAETPKKGKRGSSKAAPASPAGEQIEGEASPAETPKKGRSKEHLISVGEADAEADAKIAVAASPRSSRIKAANSNEVFAPKAAASPSDKRGSDKRKSSRRSAPAAAAAAEDEAA